MSREVRTLYLIRLVDFAVRLSLDAALKEVGSTIAQYTLLSILRDKADAYSSADIARRLHITAQAANETIIALETKQLIVRRTDPNHARIRLVKLTPSGRRLLDDLDRHVDRVEQAMMSVLSERELNTLRGHLGRIIKASQKPQAASVRAR